MNNQVDKMTGLLSKGEILNCVQEVDARIKQENEKDSGDRRYSVAFVDLDNFKYINDKYGHNAADRVLIEIAGVLKEHLEDRWFAGRVGGDEFMVVFDNASFEETFIKMEDIRRTIKDTDFRFTIDDKEVIVNTTCSIGIASYPKDGKNSEEVVRAADEAIYRAKKEGRDRIYIAIEEKKIPKTIYFTKSQIKRIGEISKNTNKIESELFREAVDRLIDYYERER
jgi:diguanylate cyclase (GGDEF)-like protein